VLIAGGSGDNEVPVSSAGMVYDPNTNTWQATHPMIAPRHLPESVRLLNGKVLVAGGIIVGDPSNSQLTTIVEIFDPSTNTWSRAADLNFARYEFVLTLLKDGRVLAIDGANRWDTQWEQNTYISEIELYDPEKDQWSMIGSLPQPTANATGILLSNNTVWVAGGQNDVRGMSIPPETWLIVPPNP
jgi:N-acetylneuraminic acid mutarotase